MNFQISGLAAERFAPLFELTDTQLAAQGAVRQTVDQKPGFPCRVSLVDAEPGETVLLVNYEHLPVNSPYRSSHAIYVRKGARTAMLAVNEIPEVLRSRLLSVRAFDMSGMMVAADVVDGQALEAVLQNLLARDEVSYLHLHNARPGCYAARVDRVPTSSPESFFP
jgi:hypothetical protein